jgi:acetyl-CoA C-acetyltransferase
MKSVYIVDGRRTAFLKSGKPGYFYASDLAVNAGRALLKSVPITASDIDEVILGCAMPTEIEANIARIVALRLECKERTPAYTVHRNCASGMQAIDNAFEDIQLGRHNLILAGGTEVMSRAPVMFNEKFVCFLADLAGAKTFGKKLSVMMRFKFSFLKPIIALLCGLTDPINGLSMGQTAENVAQKFKISRKDMDEFSVESHQRLAKAYMEKNMGEVVPLYDDKGKLFESDTGLRPDSSVEKLAKLKPFFDKKFGDVTAGNSSQVTDGAAVVLLASAEAVKQHHLPVMARIVDIEWAGCDPAFMGLGPVYASTPLLKRNNLTLNDIHYWEINEAFAAQVLGCVKAWENDEFCKKELGLEKAFGSIDRSRLNVDGGAIALGHPIGASGARIVLHLSKVLRRNNARYGVATICIGGGQGGAVLIENVDHVEAE